MTIRIIGMEESEGLIFNLSKYVEKSKIEVLNIPSKKRGFLINHNIGFFKSEEVLERIEELKEIKNQFDLCVVSSWSTARIAYLADLNYIIFFVGHDIRIPPFVKNSKPDYFKEHVNKLNFLERTFYKQVFKNAVACVTGSQELFEYLKKYRRDAIRIDRTIVDTKIFRPDIKPEELQKTKFTFFSPQKIGIEKGTDILWKSISYCKSDFEVLQVDWIDDKSPEAKRTSEKIIKTKPNVVKLIDSIKHEDMPKFYAFADAILGEMETGHTNSIEREGSLCKKPVLNYNNLNMRVLIDGKEVNTPFLPTSKEPKKIAEVIDRVVTSKEFREKLAKQEFEFMKELADPKKAAKEWDNLFEKMFKQYETIDKNSSFFSKKMRLILFLLTNKLSFRKHNQLP